LLYEINNSDILNLENAAQVAIESNNYVESLKYYTELKNNEYLNSGKLYYAYNKISEKEDQFSTLEERNNAIKMPNYEKPREEPASTKKPFVYKTVAILLVENKQIEEAKKVYKDAKILNPDDMEILTSEASLYYPNDMETYKSLIKEIVVKDPNNPIMFYNIGYATLIDDAKIVDEINSNLNNPEVYKELTTKRKEMYQSALPFFEKSYKLDPSIEDTKQILKATYKILGMKEEEAKL
jgi:tetratricopeptide (TPR) repeat protein